MGTPFCDIYDRFFGRITSEMMIEMNETDVYDQLQSILLNAIPRFKLPRFDIFDYTEGSYDYLGHYKGSIDTDYLSGDAFGWRGGSFNIEITEEEVNILSLAMLVEWLWQQLATTELTRMKFSGSDFKLSSQANHLAKLKVMVDKAEQDLNLLEDTYHRRQKVKSEYQSTFGNIMAKPSYGYKITVGKGDD